MAGNMHPESQYYLHENGDVIYKPHGGVDSSSDFVVRVWNVNVIGKKPEIFADWLFELYSLDANHERIVQLAEHNKLFDFIPELLNIFKEKGLIK